MSLSSIEFVALLPMIIAVYWLLWNRRLQHVFLAIATALFIAFNGGFHLWVFLGVLAGTAALMALADVFAPRRRLILGAAVVALVLVLCYFKYLGWFARLWSWQIAAPPQPLGISYYVFILIGFVLDAANRGLPLPPRRLPALMMFFPFLLSGPIVRLRSWSAQVSRRRKRRVARNITIGTHLFLLGAFKKILIADAIAVSMAPVWANPAEYSPAAIAMAVGGFYVQLYADFSGYTDMARGVARMMGFHLPINFKAPYFAATPTEFWSRWHMSLTGWIRDYVFTPLSVFAFRRVRSKRAAPVVTFALVVLLMTLVGLWHGASNTLVLFGAVHGVLIGAWYSVVGSGRRLTRGQRVLSWAVFQLVLILSMTMFRADTLSAAGDVLRGLLLSPGTGSLSDAVIGLVLATAMVFLLQRFELRPTRIMASCRGELRLFPVYVAFILLVVYMKGLTLEGVWIAPGDPFFNQGQEKFIYLQF